VHIFPARLGDADARALQKSFQAEPELVGFWNSLKPMYDFFETTRRVPAVSVDNDGAYILRGAAEPSGKKPLGSPVGGPGS
jgi:murein L,D-transpeptidase YafK